jgi:crotonobetainyl-CoA:carnitine CoA-transferase CaiB-like acyl-CoA transferase
VSTPTNDLPHGPSPAPVSGPLSGIVVADFSRVLAGPYATMLLADLGAEVIKVESPAGDDTRHWVPPRRGDVGTYFIAVNRNKRSIVLDLGDEEDAAVAHALSERADVFIHNFKPGGLTRFGLDHAAVSARNPRSIYCSISGFGTAKGAALPGYDLLVQGMSGLMSLTGSPDGPPYRSGISVFDLMTGLHSAIGILAALHHRDETGQGQHIETNLLSSALSGLVNQTSAYVAGDVVPQRMGNAHLSLFPYEPLATGDGDLIIAAGNDGQFRRLAAALGAPELGDDDRFSSVGKRNENRDQLRPLLLDLLATRSAQEWFAILSDAGIPCGPINDVRGGVQLATDLGLEPVVMVGDVPTVRNPIRMSATPARHDLAPPALNADGDDIRAWLGFARPDPEGTSAS